VAPAELTASTVISAGRFSAGGVVSRTVTVKLPEAKLKLESRVQQKTVVDPIRNVEPESGKQDTEVDPSTRSVALTVKSTTAPDELVASAVMFPGRLRMGGVVSRTRT
jgi:predicted dinucleotide-binding enzyme